MFFVMSSCSGGLLLILLLFCILVNLSCQACRSYPSCCETIESVPCEGNIPCAGGRLSCDPSGSCCCIKFNPTYMHLATGAKKPPLVPNKPRAYYMRFCPYSHTVMLVSQAKNISLDVVYVNIKDPPDWFRNELGGIPPVMEIDNQSLMNVPIIQAELLNDAYPIKGELYPFKSYQKVADRVIIDDFHKKMGPLFKDILYITGLESPEKVPVLFKRYEDGITSLGEELSRRGTKFFGGDDKPGMVDYMIWPWFERKPLLQMVYPKAYDYGQTSAKMISWMEEMKKVDVVESLRTSEQVHYEFTTSYRKGKPKFDILGGL